MHRRNNLRSSMSSVANPMNETVPSSNKLLSNTRNLQLDSMINSTIKWDTQLDRFINHCSAVVGWCWTRAHQLIIYNNRQRQLYPDLDRNIQINAKWKTKQINFADRGNWFYAAPDLHTHKQWTIWEKPNRAETIHLKCQTHTKKILAKFNRRS